MADRKEPPFYNDDSVGAFQYKLPFYETMELFIETLTGTCFELRVSPFETVISVKAKIQRLEGIPVAQQHLIWNNLELEDEYCLHDYSIAEGCTLKLVLALRGGPINTRRVAMEDPVREMADLMDAGKEEGWDKSLPKKEVTFLVYREGDQLNFFRVVDRGDGTLTPVSESLGGGSVYNVYTEEEEYGGGYSAATQQALENGITKNKMNLLKSKMEDMNLNKKPKKSTKLKPRPPVGPRPPTSPRPCSSSLAPPNARHHRLLRVLPQINQPHHSTSQLPPIRDQESTNPSPPGAVSSPAHLSVARQAPPAFASSCYMLQEEEPWESCSPLAKIRPPPKVSRLDLCGARRLNRLMRDCVYPQLPALSAATRRQAEGTAELSEPMRDLLGLGSLEEAGGLMEPLQAGASYGDLLSDPLSLDVSTPTEGDLDGLEPLEMGAERHLASTPTLLSQVVVSGGAAAWGLGPADPLAGRGERTQLGIGDNSHIGTASPSPSPASTTPPPFTVQLPRPFEFTGSTLLRRPIPPPSRPSAGDDSPSPPLSSPPRSSRPRGVMVDSPGKRPEVISKSEARGITRMANQACKEPLGSLSNSELLASLGASLGASRTGANSGEGLGQSLGLGLGLPDAGASGSGRQGCASPALMASIQLLQEDLLRRMPPLHRAAASYMSSNSLGSAGGTASSARRLGSSSYHLPPVEAAVARKKKSSRHCFLCGKKTGLASSYECRCGDNFCATHRYAETHDCTYDYKSTGRRVLQETNPIISAPKLPKI